MKIVNAISDFEPAKVRFLIRKDDGRLMQKVIDSPFVSFVKTSDLTPLVKLAINNSQYIKEVKQEGIFTRITWVSYEARKSGVDPEGYLGKLNITSYEGDVHPIRRILSDDHSYEIAKPRRLFLDIETDSRVSFSHKEDMRILCWCAADTEGNTFEGVLKSFDDESEYDILAAFWKIAESYDQLIAWNGDRFDFELLKERSKRVGLRVKDFRRWLYLDHLVLFKRQNMNSSDSGEEKQSYKLDDIANAVLKKGKLEDFDSSKTYEAWATSPETRATLVKYCMRDTLLLNEIEDKTGYIALFQALCEACKCFPETRSLNPTVQMDGFMLSLGMEKNYHFPTKYYEDFTPDKYPGAYVQDPSAEGIAKNVHVGDFKSLYPSIIITWNMSPETKGKKIYTSRGETPEPNYCVAPTTGLTFRTDIPGILPIALKTLIKLRKVWADKRASLPPGTQEAKEAERRSTAYKVAANSFYGVVGSQYSRFYDRDIAESITQTGAYLIKETMKAAERKGWRSIYGDTDSVFIMGVDEQTFRAFVDECNKTLYPKITSKCIENTVCLDCEKGFARIVFTSAKRYCGFYSYYKNAKANPDSEPEIKGLEYKRGDTPKLARTLQKRAIDMICKEGLEDPEIYLALLRKSKAWIMETPLAKSLVQISKSISKPLDEYINKEKLDGSKAEDLIHVKIAKILKDRGQDITQGSRVFYVVTDASTSPMQAIPADDYKGQFDVYYMWEKLIYPPTMRLLCAAFPARAPEFESLANVRPSKRARVAEEQLDLGLIPPKAIAQTEPPLKPPFDPSSPLPPIQPSNVSFSATGTLSRASLTVAGNTVRPYIVTISQHIASTYTDHKAIMQRLGQLLESYPGKRPVRLEIETGEGTSVSLSLPHKVSVTPGLLASVKLLFPLTRVNRGVSWVSKKV